MGQSAYWNWQRRALAWRHWAMRTAVCVPGHVIRGEQSGKARRAYPPSGGLSFFLNEATVAPPATYHHRRDSR